MTIRKQAGSSATKQSNVTLEAQATIESQSATIHKQQSYPEHQYTRIESTRIGSPLAITRPHPHLPLEAMLEKVRVIFEPREKSMDDWPIPEMWSPRLLPTDRARSAAGSSPYRCKVPCLLSKPPA